MFFIEKTVSSSASDLSAHYVQSESHMWVPAWRDANNSVRNMKLDEAIAFFKDRVKKVKNCGYRLRFLGQNVVVSAVNVNGADLLERFAINALEFNEDPEIGTQVIEAMGTLHCTSGGQYLVGDYNPRSTLSEQLNKVASCMQKCIKSHSLEVRTNSNQLSGGVWLITSPIKVLFSNTDVGICVSQAGEFVLNVSHKFIHKGFGNTVDRNSGKVGYRQHHLKLEDAIADLKRVVIQSKNN